jgi:hypothetical protein
MESGSSPATAKPFALFVSGCRNYDSACDLSPNAYHSLRAGSATRAGNTECFQLTF